MTVGQRIAQKRKELGLSQEGLGERLGVSRQAIYKWESDAALPEVEKLVNLSREFSVSVGWLLGEEDGAPERPELTAEQLRMVEEIVGRYIAARPESAPAPEGKEPRPEPKASRKRRRWPYVLACAAVAVLIGVFSNLFSRLDQLYRDTQNLQMNVGEISYNVDRQINGIASRVEEVLQSQNALTAEQGAEIASADYRANTVTIEARAVPRTYVEGMTAEFTLMSGGETAAAPGELGENHAFTARITGPLTDEVTVSVAFLTGDQRQTQVLEQFTGQYTMSFPDVTIAGGMSRAIKADGAAGWTAYFPPVDVYCYDRANGRAAGVTSLRLGLFRDQELVRWFSEDEGTSRPREGRYVFELGQEEVLLETGHSYCIAAVVEDEFGREWVAPEYHVQTVTEEGSIEHDYAEYSRDPADWDY